MEKAEKKTKMSRKMDAFQVVLYVIVTIYCLSMIYVLLFGFVNSLKDATDYEWNNPFGLPSKEFGWHFDNYAKVLNDFKVFTLGGNEVYLMQMFFHTFNQRFLQFPREFRPEITGDSQKQSFVPNHLDLYRHHGINLYFADLFSGKAKKIIDKFTCLTLVCRQFLHGNSICFQLLVRNITFNGTAVNFFKIHIIRLRE